MAESVAPTVERLLGSPDLLVAMRAAAHAAARPRSALDVVEQVIRDYEHRRHR
jgi:UDP-N-acetylglucosamine:LPS N-acetylglucosamine transferase